MQTGVHGSRWKESVRGVKYPRVKKEFSERFSAGDGSVKRAVLLRIEVRE
jgi:hypothetical protein